MELKQQKLVITFILTSLRAALSLLYMNFWLMGIAPVTVAAVTSDPGPVTEV